MSLNLQLDRLYILVFNLENNFPRIIYLPVPKIKVKKVQHKVYELLRAQADDPPIDGFRR